MSEPTKKRPGRPRSIESHQAILQATIDLLIEVGVANISVDAIATRAGVGKTTIYRRYSSKEELLADAIESLRQEVVIPDTGSFWGDIDSLIESAAQLTLNPFGQQTVAMIVSTALTNPQFAQMYWAKYLQPRRQAFSIVLERAKLRGELLTNAESDLFFDTISSLMLYASVFPPTTESWQAYVRRMLNFLFQDKMA
ncbi:TetR/AcrR family transcriptional regulator [Nostocaceae cyanobacterium CENA369]|uniref:TetR/AcrR family transcriptional regulator n=1 Tax=Dendronalium phyllosphericum CENA369 TaxID=1725256 RepID=A0A8J7I1Q1_9NOST|nr:TetR/AcrR family transcriptional regulator [Dendronalium phyllosphericum]MBH8573025.1 TetR/AcrR family transcriptional regulator [Dendronalium phyllosphericum CENA369]